MKLSPLRPIGFFALAIPFLAMIYLIASNEWDIRKYHEYRVEVVGYDPVNILTGHYLTFRYKWPESAKNSCTPDDECFACINGDDKKPDISLVPTKDIEACEAALILENGQPDRNMTTYHISETEAPVLDEMLRGGTAKFEIGILVYPDHNGQIRNLYINDEKLSDFFK